jgi:hypothetical protein
MSLSTDEPFCSGYELATSDVDSDVGLATLRAIGVRR